MNSTLNFSMRFKLLGSNGNLAIAAPLVDGDESQTANTAAGRMGTWYDRTGGLERIVSTVLGTDVLSVYQGSVKVLGSTVWTAATLDPTLYQLLSGKGAASGYAGLDGSGKVPLAQLPASVANQMFYVSGWNASSNSPSIVSSSGTLGQFYEVTTAGVTNIDGNTEWYPGDLIWFNGSQWQRILGNPIFVTPPAAVVLVSTVATTVDSFADDSAVMYQWDLVINNGAGNVQCYKVMAARTGVSTFSVNTTVTAGNASGDVTTIAVALVTGNIVLRVTMGTTGYSANVRRWKSLV